MSNILKQPYEISIWDDVLTTDYIDENGDKYNCSYFKENKIAIIGSDTMTAPFRCREPQFKENINGTVTLTFSMYNRYYDEDKEEFIFNPYNDLMVNERKIKIKYKEKWYDLIIKNIQESSDKKSFTYTCQSLPICELSKNGFNIEFKNDLQNNVKTINEFAEEILEGTDWKLQEEIELKEKQEEPVIELKTITEFMAYNMDNEDEELTIESGKTIYASYSTYNEGITFLTFLYKEEQDYEKDESTRIIINADCYYVKNPEWKEGKWDKVEYKGISTEFRGEFYNKRQQTTYDAVLNRYVDIYKDENGKEVYGYTESKYEEPIIVTNLITNDPQSFFIDYDEEGAKYGWEVDPSGGSSVTFNFNPAPILGTDDTTGEFVLNYFNNESDTLTVLGFSEESFVHNTGFEDQLENLSTIAQGETYRFRVEGCYLGDNNPGSCLSMEQGAGLINQDGKFYFNSINGGALQLKVIEYTLDEKGSYVFGTVYFSEKIKFEGKPNLGKYLDYTVEGKFINGLSYNKMLKERVGVFIFDAETFGTDEKKHYYGIKTLEFYKKETYKKDGEEVVCEPNSINTDSESIINSVYRYYYPLIGEEGFSEQFNNIENTDNTITANNISIDRIDEYVLSFEVDETDENNKIDFSIKIITSEGTVNDWQTGSMSINKSGWYAFNLNRVPNNTKEIGFSIKYEDNKTLTIKDNNLFLKSYNIVPAEEDIVYIEEDQISNLTPLYDSGYIKKRTIEAAESNRFNILQSLCETFECWIGFNVEHNANGTIKTEKLGDEATGYSVRQLKSIYFYDYLGDTIKYPGFRYGINLQSTQRTLDSDQIVSRIYVKDGSNSVAENGICSIRDAQSNPTGEQFFYDFSYYINQKLLNYDEVIKDLYGTTEEGLGYYQTYKGYNTKQQEISLKMAELSPAIIELDASVSVLKEQVAATGEEITTLKKEITAITGAEDYSIITFPYISVISKLFGVLALSAVNTVNNGTLNGQTASLVELQETYTALQTEFDQYTELKKALNQKFYQKYSRFIQEGSWTSNDYIDPELYYLDAQNVLSTSVSPKVTYTMNVIDVSQQEGFENYQYRVGDHTFIEDTEFFGWLTTKDSNGNNIYTPYKEEVIISEIINYLDNPESNKFSIQNYKTQFEDLFQRITATTQSLQFASGAYNRASNSVNPDGTFDADSLQETLLTKAFTLLNPENETIRWDSEGLQIIDKINTSRIIRLSNGTISITRDGGQTWSTALNADGLKIDLLSSGIINTDKILIGNAENYSFRWDSTGLNAYTKKADENGNLVSYNYGKFVRFDQFGLYGYSKGTVFTPEDVDDVKKNADFGLTWDGFFLKSKHNNGYIEIDSQDDFRVMVDPDGNGEYIERIKVGLLNGTDNYGITINDSTGTSVFNTDKDGNLFVRGHIIASSGSFSGKIEAEEGEIGGWTINTGNLSSVVGEQGIVLDAANSQIHSQKYDSNKTGTGWMINNDEAIFNNITLRGALKCAVLEYAEVQAIGGIMMIRPATTIKSYSYDESNKILTVKVENSINFKIGDFCKFATEIETFRDENFNTTDGGVVIEGGINSHLYQLISFGEEENTLQFSINSTNWTDLKERNLDGIGIVSLGNQGDVGLGLNSSTNRAMIPSTSFSVFSFEEDAITKWKYLKPHIVLGKIPNDSFYDEEIRGKYGLYADAAEITGIIRAKTLYLGNSKNNAVDSNGKILSDYLDTSNIDAQISQINNDINIVNTAVETLQKEVDGAISTWYEEGDPTVNTSRPWLDDDNLNNDTDEEHIGDLYYDRDTGKAYRFLLEDSIYKWIPIADEDIQKALAEINILQQDQAAIQESLGEVSTNITKLNGEAILVTQEYTSVGGNKVTQNFKLSTNGLLTANNAVISGKIIANEGSIGGWNIIGGVLYNAATTTASTMWLSPEGTSATINNTTAKMTIRAGNNFGVDINGILYAINAIIDGTIYASAGEIGGWTIGSGYLMGGGGTFFLRPISSDNEASTGGIICAGLNNGNYNFRVLGTGTTLIGYNGSDYNVRIDSDGGVSITGIINAQAGGTIAGFSIDSTYIQTADKGVGFGSDSDWSFWAGWTSGNSAPFQVKADGTLVATNATITGTVTATEGQFGSLIIKKEIVGGVTFTLLSSENDEFRLSPEGLNFNLLNLFLTLRTEDATTGELTKINAFLAKRNDSTDEEEIYTGIFYCDEISTEYLIATELEADYIIGDPIFSSVKFTFDYFDTNDVEQVQSMLTINSGSDPEVCCVNVETSNFSLGINSAEQISAGNGTGILITKDGILLNVVENFLLISTNSFSTPYDFLVDGEIDGGSLVSQSGLTLGKAAGNVGFIEMYGDTTTKTPYIDFHYNNSTVDYTSRIIENRNGGIDIIGSGGTYISTGKTMNNKTNCLHLQCPQGGAVVIDNGYSGSSENTGGAATPSVWEDCIFRTSSNAAKAYCFGSWYLSTSTLITSDINFKHSIEKQSDNYSILFDNLNPIRYKYNNNTSNRYHTGFIAQEVEEAILSAKLTTQDFAGFVRDYETEIDLETGEEVQVERCYLRYEEFIALNTNEIQKLKKRVTELETQLAELLNQ